MSRRDIRQADLRVGESVAVINEAGILVAEGEIEQLEVRNYSGLELTVAGCHLMISSWKSEYAVVNQGDYHAIALTMAQTQWMEVVGRKCKYVREALPPEVMAQAVELTRALEALVDPYIAEEDKDRGFDYKSHESLRGNHALNEADSITAGNKELFSGLHRETESQASKVRSALK